MILITVVAALCKIKYYQKCIIERTFISLHAFQKLIKEISNQYDVRDKDGFVTKFYRTKNAIFALQFMTKDILTMIFEMTYSGLAYLTDQ